MAHAKSKLTPKSSRRARTTRIEYPFGTMTISDGSVVIDFLTPDQKAKRLSDPSLYARFPTFRQTSQKAPQRSQQ